MQENVICETNSQLPLLLSQCRQKFLRAGEVLFLQGDRADYLYLIQSGEIRHIYQDEQGREVILARSSAGDIVGVGSQLCPPMVEFHTIVHQPTCLCIIPPVILKQLHQDLSSLSILLVKLGDYILKISKALQILLLPSIEMRLAALFQYLVDQSGFVLKGLSQQDISYMIDASRPKVNGQLQQWVRQDVIRLGRRSVHILDLEYLRKLVII